MRPGKHYTIKIRSINPLQFLVQSTVDFHPSDGPRIEGVHTESMNFGILKLSIPEKEEKGCCSRIQEAVSSFFFSSQITKKNN